MTCATWIRSALSKYRYIFHLCLSIDKVLNTRSSPWDYISYADHSLRSGRGCIDAWSYAQTKKDLLRMLGIKGLGP